MMLESTLPLYPIFGLVKVYPTQDHAEALFQRGQMHMKSLAWFRRMGKEGTGRGDPNDGDNLVFQPNDVNLYSRLPDGKDVLISKVGLKAIRDSDDETTRSHVFCSYMLNNQHLANARAGLPILDPRISDLGGFAVLIYHPRRFFKMVATATDGAGLEVKDAHVEYIDFERHNGSVGIFRKSDAYAYQHEYRIAVPGEGKDWINLEVGSLAEVAHCCPVDGLDGSLSQLLLAMPMEVRKG